jgi:hypothetical protein
MYRTAQTSYGTVHTWEGAGPHPAVATSRVLRVAVEGGSVSFVGGLTADAAQPILDREGRLLTLSVDGWTSIENPPPFIRPMFSVGRLTIIVGA